VDVWFAMLGWYRETLMIAALAALAGAGVVVSVGAWVLLFRDRRRSRNSGG
jgi:hypothetical protein